jgi:hypothetical protein
MAPPRDRGVVKGCAGAGRWVFLGYDLEIRTILCSTNAIESLSSPIPAGSLGPGAISDRSGRLEMPHLLGPGEQTRLSAQTAEQANGGDVVVTYVRGRSASREGRCSAATAASIAVNSEDGEHVGLGENATTLSSALRVAWSTPLGHEQLPPVDVVRQRPAVQTEEQQWHELHQAERPDCRARGVAWRKCRPDWTPVPTGLYQSCDHATLGPSQGERPRRSGCYATHREPGPAAFTCRRRPSASAGPQRVRDGDGGGKRVERLVEQGMDGARRQVEGRSGLGH